MAPTIRYHDGTFYVINCNFSDKGNFIVTAQDPAGPWSKPHWLTDVPGIDASIFFDEDGKCYIMGTGENWPDGKGGLRQGIWAAEYDVENFRMAGDPVTLWGGALAGAASPEAPHLYHIGDWYYLLIAEGGTEYFHAVTIARSRSVFGPYEGYSGNPILTMRHMGKHALIQNAGHADLVELPDGSWYGVFLASRLIGGVSKNLGRETFIVPVRWEDDWPLFTPDTGRVEWEYPFPECLPWTPLPEKPFRDDFDSFALDLNWSCWGTPYEKFWSIADSKLSLRCLPQSLADPLRALSMEVAFSRENYVSYLAYRRRQPHCRFACSMRFTSSGAESAGIAVIQAMNHQIHLQLSRAEGEQKLELLLFTADYDRLPFIPGFTSVTNRTLLASVPWAEDEIVLEMELIENDYIFRYGPDEQRLTEIGRADGALINPEKVGCMVGEMLGVFASGNGTDSDNCAVFDWAEYRDL
jgi:alpha-N-arabinofuranosidase